MKLELALQLAAIIVVGTVGNLLYKHGVDAADGLNPFTLPHVARFLFSPGVFAALSLMFLGRLLWALPLRTAGVGYLAIVIAPASIAVLVVASHLLLKETFTTPQVAGIVLALGSLMLMGDPT